MYGTQDMARYRMADRMREAEAHRMAVEASARSERGERRSRLGSAVHAAATALTSVVGGARLRPAATTSH